MASHEIPHEREADAEALADALGRFVDLHEEVEDLRELVGRNADAVVGHADHHVGALGTRRDLDAAAGLGVLDRVEDDVLEDLLQAHAIGVQPDRIRGNVDRDLVASRLQRCAARLERMPDFRADIQRLAPQLDRPPSDARDVEQVIHEARHLRDLAVHGFQQRTPALGIVAAGLEHVQRSAHRGERVAQLVR